MKKRLLFALLFSLIAINSAAAQKRTVTNDDLEKYRQKRVAAERDLRENYERLGFPSPEALQKQIEKSQAERSALAARIEAENLQREQLNLERQRVENEARSLSYQPPTESSVTYQNRYVYDYAPNGFYTFPNNRINRDNYGRGNRRNRPNQPRIEYRNNLPVIVSPPPQRILAPRPTSRSRRN